MRCLEVVLTNNKIQLKIREQLSIHEKKSVSDLYTYLISVDYLRK